MAALTTIQSYNSFSSSLNLEFGLGNSLVGTATGNASISGGVLDMTGADYKKVMWAETPGNLPLGQKFGFLTEFRPGFSGIPSSRQVIFVTTQLLGIGNNYVYFYVSAVTGDLELYMVGQNGVTVVSYITGATSFVAGNWYWIGFNYDFSSGTAGFTNIILGANRIASETGITYTRLPLNTYFQVGGDASDNATHVMNGSFRNMYLFNEPFCTGATWAGSYSATPSLAVQAVPDANQLKTGVQANYGLITGTYTGTERYTEVPEAKVESGYAYAYNSLTNNKTGSLSTGVTNTISSQTVEAGSFEAILEEA